MEALAGRLALHADEIATAARGFSARAESLDFMGPAATRFRASIEAQRTRSEATAERVLEMSQALRRAAETARLQIADWERLQASQRDRS